MGVYLVLKRLHYFWISEYKTKGHKKEAEESVNTNEPPKYSHISYLNL
jgi:hypothetical protein